jgi:hypothetical protein
LQKEIDEFLQKNQILRNDQGYVDFLETYSAASVDWPNEMLIIQIYGFSPEITIEVAHPDEALVDKDGFFRFAEIILKTGDTKKDFVGLSYAYDTTGKRPYGVYQSTLPYGADFRTIPYKSYGNSFLAWLKDVIEKKGKLIYIDVEML